MSHDGQLTRVLVLGAGQLARMMALAGAPLNIQLMSYDVRSQLIVEPIWQTPLSLTLDEAIIQADTITAEFEHIPVALLSKCQQSGKLFPSAESIEIGADRRSEKALLAKLGIPSSPFVVVKNYADLLHAADILSFPLIIKTAKEGYDGKGQWRFKNQAEIDAHWGELASVLNKPNQGLIAEQWVTFTRELSVIGARDQHGKCVIYPITENIHHQGILALSLQTPQPKALQQAAAQIFQTIATGLDYVGILSVELFDFGEDHSLAQRLWVNEIAPRVHNSGHWTQQGASVCQFEQHLRAVCQLPLAKPQIQPASAMINLVGELSLPESLAPMGHWHWYNKAPKPQRKIGHVNFTASSEAELFSQLKDFASKAPKSDFPALIETLNQA